MRFQEFKTKINENEVSLDHEKLAAAADEQRGWPEIAMVEAQYLHGGGVLSFCIEHTGDLYNRMHNTGYGDLGDRSSDNERRHVVLEKIEKVLRVLTNPYGFEKEHEENMQNNPRSMNVDPQEYRDRLEKALKRYAEEHRKLPVYNLPQKLARQASMALGLGQYGTARLALWDLQDLAKDQEKWFDIVNVIDPKYSSGKPFRADKEYPERDDYYESLQEEFKKFSETIRKVKDGYRLVSKKGKNLGTYPTRAGAKKRERQVQYFKHMGENTVIDYMSGHCHVMALAIKMLNPTWQIRARIGWDEDAENDEDYRIDHVYIVSPDGSAYDCRGKFKSEDELVGSDQTGGIETQLVDYTLKQLEDDVARGELKAYSKSDILNAAKFFKQQINENFADGKVKGKSRPGRVKRAGASCKGSVTDLKAKAKKYSGEKGKMYRWCANMKAGRKK